MKIAVVGSAGLLGSEVMNAARQLGHVVTGLTHDDIEITDAGSVETALAGSHVDIVVNCAAYVRVDDAESHVPEAFAANAVGPFNIATAARDRGARLIHISTDFVFDGSADSPIDEGHSPKPINVYGISKLAGENLVMQVSKDNLIVRVSSLFGTRGASGKPGGNFISTILGIAERTGHVSAIDDLIISPTYAVDAAVAVVELAEAGASGICHVVNTGVCSWYELAKYAVGHVYPNAVVAPVGSDEYPTVAARPRYTALSTSKLVDEFGIDMRPWEAAVVEFLESAGHIGRE